MSTNYYMHWTPPGVSGIELQTHICTSLVVFDGRMFASWQDWKRFMLHNAERIRIVDEYDREHTLTEFIASVENTEVSNRAKQYHWMQANYPNTLIPETEWLDADGFSFTAMEFS